MHWPDAAEEALGRENRDRKSPGGGLQEGFSGGARATAVTKDKSSRAPLWARILPGADGGME